uniref:alpha-tocopherol transfer protein-like isoform X3 n=1 Tax=Myxine glutinosa TaxID=7769 RepID=UPI00358F932E
MSADMDDESPADHDEVPGAMVDARVLSLRIRAREELGDSGESLLCSSRDFLLRFLRSRDFHEDEALKVLLNYHRWRREAPEICSELTVTSVQNLLHSGYLAVLNGRDVHGSRVLVYRIDHWDPERVSAHEAFRISLIASELLVHEVETQRCGVRIVFDLQGLTFAHLTQLGPSLTRKIATIITNSFPIKVRAVHLLNAPSLFRAFLGAILPLLSNKIRSRILLHRSQDFELLHSSVPLDVLPTEFGGQVATLDVLSAAWARRVLHSERVLLALGPRHAEVCSCAGD